MKRMRMVGVIAALAFGATAAWAKLPPPPPVDPAAKAAADEKKKQAAEKEKAELSAAQENAVKNWQSNMKAAGKPLPKSQAVAAPAKPGDKAAPKDAGKAAQKKT